MDIGRQQRVIMVEPIGLTMDDELEELSGELSHPGEAWDPAEAEENASSDPLE